MAASTKRKTAQPAVKQKVGRAAGRAPASRSKVAAARSRAAATAGLTAAGAVAALTRLGSASAAAFAQRFFKTGAGQYGAGDAFLGIRVPVLRAFVRDLKGAGLEVALPLLKSSWHEVRAVALILLVRLYERGDENTRQRIYSLYLKSTKFINNWDLVDLSAAPIIGGWLADKPGLRKQVLTRLAKSKSLWERRMAMLATYHYIKQGNANDALRVAKILLDDKEDLIHKAVGWMLREIGLRVSQEVEELFLRQYYRKMPRTMLRYAIERFAEPRRQAYLHGLV
jgi:3-methyladenine DNA glycosylase AlkD